MIHSTLSFLTGELNSYLNRKSDTSSDTKIVLTGVANPSGVLIPSQKLGLSLINIEEDRVFKDQRVAVRNNTGDTVNRNPDLNLNLYILITANFQNENTSDPSDDYVEGLKQLSYVMAFFQGKNVFTQANSPALSGFEGNIDKLVVELFSFTFEQMNHFWSVVGTNYLPSVLYKVRLITLQENESEPIGLVEDLRLNMGGKN